MIEQHCSAHESVRRFVENFSVQFELREQHRHASCVCVRARAQAGACFTSQVKVYRQHVRDIESIEVEGILWPLKLILLGSKIESM